MTEARGRASIYLVGFMGCGKSTVARALADVTGLPVLDTDAVIESHAGLTIARLIDERGQEGFRRLERDLFEREVAGARAVVATGGGLPTSHRVRWTMRRTGRTVWLDSPLETCAARVGSGRGRPLWAGADPLELRTLYERRRAIYALCGLRIDGVGEPAEVASRALAGLGLEPGPGSQD